MLTKQQIEGVFMNLSTALQSIKSPIAIVIITQDGAILTMNQEMISLPDTDKDRLIDNTIDCLEKNLGLQYD